MAGFAGAATIIGSALLVLLSDRPGRSAEEVKTTIARRDLSTPDELAAQLGRMPLLDLTSLEAAAKYREALQTFADLRKPKEKTGATIREPWPGLAVETLEKERSKLCLTLGLPAREGKSSQLDAKEAEHLQTVAALLRRHGAVSVLGRRGEAELEPPKIGSWDQLHQAVRLTPGMGGMVHFDRAVVQMLQVEDETRRLMLVDGLKRMPEVAVIPLVERAIYDVSPAVREAAIAALSERPSEQYRPVLLNALRHPWAAAADHAAEALVALQDHEAVPLLKPLLFRTNPCAPEASSEADAKPLVREVIRVNHLRNCMLCHAPAVGDGKELVVAPVPTPGQPLPVAYYGSRGGSRLGVLVRADITYLKQDFSVMQRVESAKPWPEQQRFDFLVRTREATPEEVAAAKKAPPSYPQREAVLWALEELERAAAAKP
jgi:hypothetical protein